MDRLPLNQWVSQVEQTIQVRRLIPDRAKILVAVSGGLDSMVLLRALHALARPHRWKLAVAHFNHQLRGPAADTDEQLVRQTAAKLNWPCFVGRADIAKAAAAAGVSLEMAGRQLRHRFLAQTARRRHCAIIALAHHADDQVELFFLRLLRGAGSDGLAGMKWSNPSPEDLTITLVRPLLNQSKGSLTAVAREARIAFSEDATNNSLDILRNRIRHELLPLLQKDYQSTLTTAVLRTMDLIGAEALAVHSLAASWLETTKGRGSFDSLPLAVQRRVLLAQLRQAGIAGDFDLIENLRANPARSFAINPQQSVSRNADGLLKWTATGPMIFDATRQRFALVGRGGRIQFAGKSIDWKITNRRDHADAEYFDAETLGREICLRHWRPGDRFHPIGAKNPRKLQDLFVNEKVPRAVRHRLLIATTGDDRIFWVEGQRIGEWFKVTGTTRNVLKWKLRI